jgi:hypothetical protein
MRLADLVAGVYARFDTAAAMADVTAICAHDRYQASAGINAAAAHVAARAEAAGLADVTVRTFPADGARRWWTYHAPESWTPLRARLTVDGTDLVRYPEQPYTLAAYSAGTVPGGRTVRMRRWSEARGDADLSGVLVVVDTPEPPSTLVARLAASGATGMVADPLGGRPGRGPDQVGRLELLPGTGIVAFSVTPPVLARLVAAADAGTAATVDVRLDPDPAPMPIVTALLPGTDGTGEEMLLSAHLCHPRPSANDNASGVAALLGTARVLRAAGSRAPGAGIRFLWGPEFTGTAAYLHDVVHAGAAPVPILAVNVDMAGEDLGGCGGPLVIERGPDDLPSPLTALVERCAALIPPRTRSYSGAVGCDPWTWRSTPFAGGSDHALSAAAPTRTPALSLGHWPDRTNHSSADTIEHVDPEELRRTSTVVAATAAALHARADRDLAADVAAATTGWAADHILSALPGRRPARPSPPAEGDVVDPHADRWARRLLEHRITVALGAVRGLGVTGAGPDDVRAADSTVSAIADAARFAIPATDDAATDGDAVVPLWNGPANLRALAAAADDDDRAWLDARLAEDRGGNYARALALLGAIDGVRDRDTAIWWAAAASGLPMPADFADRFFDLLGPAGWVATAVPAGASGPAGRVTTDERGC